MKFAAIVLAASTLILGNAQFNNFGVGNGFNPSLNRGLNGLGLNDGFNNGFGRNFNDRNRNGVDDRIERGRGGFIDRDRNGFDDRLQNNRFNNGRIY
jgi:hypothetical protein